ncbi:hypothetical protein JOQ06_027901 [Pogonophryne albipinna]|uniref:DRBM domain-containing protein n=1 Tax=Pogonophryne albipinna TaxID=1090488 RepID=A0AAD6A5W6_9TELE|nr:hypothetical protein JOQ06_027901 [Pogonophryne albipinna]
MLLQLGYKASTGPQSPTELGYKASTGPQSPTEMDNKGWNGQKASFTEATSNTQKGLLHLSPDVYQEMEASRKQGGGVSPGINNSGNSGNSYMTSKDMPPYFSSSSPSPTATMAREMLLNGQTPANAELHLKGKNCGVNVQPAQQLDYLARIQGFQVQYSDAQSGKDFVTYLTLSPVQMTFHGTGSTLQASHDQAALSALKQLSEQGLDPVDGAIKSSEVCVREDGH